MRNETIENSCVPENLLPSVRRLWSRYYPDSQPDRFKELLFQNVHPTDQVLEIGAGSGAGNQNHFELRDKVARYIGIDPDSSVLMNPYLDEAHQGRADSLPFANESFDLVFHYFVAEHFKSPIDCNREIARVLKPGGKLIFQTPSRFYYPMLAAQITPHWFHEFYVLHFGSGRSSKEVFPTFYRINDDKTIRKQFGSCGLTCEIQHHISPPGYLRFSSLSFLLGVLFERTLERIFPSLRATIIVVATKSAQDEVQNENVASIDVP